MTRPNDEAPLVEVLSAVNAMRAGNDVDLAALRASVISKHDQIEALSRTTPGLDVLIEMTVPMLRVVDRLDAGDVDGAVDMVSMLLRYS